MPKDWEGYDDRPNVQVSEAAGGGKRKVNRQPGFEGHSEKNLVPSEALKGAGRKSAGPPKAKPETYRGGG